MIVDITEKRSLLHNYGKFTDIYYLQMQEFAKCYNNNSLFIYLDQLYMFRVIYFATFTK